MAILDGLFNSWVTRANSATLSHDAICVVSDFLVMHMENIKKDKEIGMVP